MIENENVQTLNLEDTIPDNTEVNENDTVLYDEESNLSNKENDYKQGELQDTENVTQAFVSETKEDAEAFVSVQYNHKNKSLTKDEAVKLIQKGMHTESLRNKLEYLADSYGMDINTLVDKMVSVPEKEHRSHLESLYGKDSPDVEIGMQIYRQKQSEEYKKIASEREDKEINERKNEEIKGVNSRLADEYLALKAAVPNAPDYSNLPDSVIVEAAQGTRDLLSSYLCHLQKEKLKIEAAKKTEEAAKNASGRSMKSIGSDNLNSQERSFLSGLWSK